MSPDRSGRHRRTSESTRKHRHHHARRRDIGAEAGAQWIATSAAATATPSRHAMRSEDVRTLHRALSRLQEDQRRIIELVDLEGLSHAVAAAAVQRSEGASRMLLRRARVNLARELDALYERRHPATPDDEA